MSRAAKVIVIGAGIGGLAAALRLRHAGLDVTVLEQHSHAGGKIRTEPTQAGPADAGPTVLTMRHVFDTLFTDIGARLEDHVTLTPLGVLARHFWADGTELDLYPDPQQSAAAVAQAFGKESGDEFLSFSERCKSLFTAFDTPIMQDAAPSLAKITRRVLTQPSLIAQMAPHRSLAGSLARQFTDPRLAQLFGRYATYVGGMPDRSPALLSLICQAEAAGVWHVAGGVHALPRAMARLAEARGVRFHFDTPARRIECQRGGVAHVHADGVRHEADIVLFNGDPRALGTGLLGHGAADAVPPAAYEPRSLSACVAAFAAEARGPELSHHNVFFSNELNAEFHAISKGRLPRDATLYVCAQDRPGDTAPRGTERFEIILNAPAGLHMNDEERDKCLTHILDRLAEFGLTFDPRPLPRALTIPQEFERLFPASQGALYGRSPHGMMAAFKRPQARTRIRGLYLAGGGAHPGAGVPMATLSARHAAEAILSDLTSASMSARTAMPGGMSTA